MSDDIFEKEVDKAVGDLNEGQSDSPQGISPEMEDQLRQIQSLASIDPSFASSKEYQDLMAALSNGSGQAASSMEDDEDYEEEEEEEEEEDDSEDIFGIMKQPKKSKEIKVTFEPTKEMISFLNNHYGVNDVSKFFSSVDTWRNQAQEGTEVKKDFEALSADLQALPPEIKMAVQLWANGDDHMSAFDMHQRLDFSADFGEQTVENLVQHYLPDEYSDLIESYENGELDDDLFEDKMILLAKTTKRMFTEDKKALDQEREQYLDRQKNEFQMMKKSALLSVENLSKAYPNFSKSEVAKIRNILVEGKVDNLFMKPDGSYNDDAAELVAYAMYGKKMLESVKKSAERMGESKANQKIVDTSPKAIKKKKSASVNQGISMDALGHLSGIFKGDPYA
jgi:hypothetical protein